MTEINRIKEKVSVILNFDTNSHPTLSQTTMTFEEHNHLMWEVFEEDILSLITTIESQKEEIEGYKAITELLLEWAKNDISIWSKVGQHVGTPKFTSLHVAKDIKHMIERLQNEQI